MGEEWRTLDLSFGCDQFWLRSKFKVWVMMMLLLSHLLALLTSLRERERERELLNIQVSHPSLLGKEKWV
jgi:uncharacterized membrane protein